ncbi:cation-translocating P-type ATPase [Acidocella aminolytica]|jgi:Ca2+-transporting ATPase|uniref:Cation transporter ATPase n=2 Tax=Acidocella TaxID=50709 RepID=A0A0D6PFP8_9PROT|nr:cation-translocating P-type ATPase [Acidocella aminolytica]GAN79659.1 cation transporter ATPase [Acidocella aminolytica 101 = DSM 11237]GBQ41323.1 cation transport ATPase [Acidocella aminolytica 101 = DSM 11237]
MAHAKPPAPQATAWYTLPPEEALTALQSDPAEGLSPETAAARARQYGLNEILEGKSRSRLSILVAQFGDFMIMLLIGAAILSGIIGNIEDTAVILAIVILNAVVGFLQEVRAANAVAALRRMTAPTATVLRGGHPQTLPATALVPGDLVLLEAGNAVPADLRLLEIAGLQMGEAALTGESTPVLKQIPASPPGTLLPERLCMAYKGTLVLSGRGRGVVTATGMETELGKIAAMLEGAPPGRTPLQLRLAQFGRQIATAALVICALIFITGLLRGEAPLLMLLTALSLAVAAIPEALPGVVTVLLALGASQMAQAKALVRRLPAVETLGSVTTICSDKTGTLTLNDMQLIEVWTPSGPLTATALHQDTHATSELLRAILLCNDSTLDETGTLLGDPTETALWHAATAAGFDVPAERAHWPRVSERQFDSERRRMTTLHQKDGRLVSYTKGAPEAVVPLCTTIPGAQPADANVIMQQAAAMAANGLRVLAIARKPHATPSPSPAALETELEFLGLAGLLDPPRPEAAIAVATCRQAGIRPVMITGDHPATARAIARALGIPDDGINGAAVLTGHDLQTMDDNALRRHVARTNIYARVDPAQKIRIVTALQSNGEIVAMTGDGVNDAPALARADIGVAMGKGGTDVAREAASLVLLDDNFATIVAAVREGRRIYDNIRKFVRFVVACNSAEIWAIFLAPFFSLPMPLLPIQILWINLVTDGLPGLALAAEPAEADIMSRPPRPPREGLFAGGMGFEVIWTGLIMAAITLLTQAAAIRAQDTHWQTMVFTVLTLVQMWQVMAIRSSHISLFQQGLLSNKKLLGAVLLTFFLQLAVIYTPGLNQVFNAQPLTLAELALAIGASSLIFILLETVKWVRRRQAGHPPLG